MMNEFTPQPGADVLAPVDGTSVVETLNYYDGPLSAILDVDGLAFLAECESGHLDTTQVWSYKVLTPGTLSEFADFTGSSQQLEAWLDARLTLAPVVLVRAEAYRICDLRRVSDLSRLDEAVAQLAA
jgi:hypothetical protein